MKKIIHIIVIVIIMAFTIYSQAKDVTIDVATEYQYIRGFGGMNMPGWIDDLTTEQVDKAFGNDPGEIGLSILRVRVPFDTTAFSLEVPSAVQTKANGAIVMASPWSPPPAMKTNSSEVGGSLAPASYGDFADHLNKFADHMASNGASLYAISIQNEPDMPGLTYESCDWTSTQMINFLTAHGSEFGSLNVIAAESFNFNHSFTDPILNDASAEPNVDIIAGHIYGSGITDYPLARTKNKEVWMTEHYTESGHSADDWPLALDVGNEIHNCMVVNFNAYVWWYVRRFYGLLLDNGNISKRGYVLSQYSKFVRPGYTRISSTASPAANVYVTAYKNDTNVVIVAVNRNATTTDLDFSLQNGSVNVVTKFTTSQTKNVNNDGTIAVSGGTFSSTLDAQSITTFTTDAAGAGSASNIPPVANAGEDQTVSDDDLNGYEPVTLDGTASNDPDGTISHFTWSEGEYEIASGDTSVINLATGTHTVILTITDDDGALDRDTVIITVDLAGGTEEAHIWLEAECGVVGSTWNIVSDGNASNGEYVVIQAGLNSTGSASENSNDHVSFTFDITEAGIYALWGRTYVPNADDDSYWVKMDSDPWIKWNGITGGASWQWDDVHNSDNASAVMSYDLDTGSHTLTIAYREDGARLDKLYLTNIGTTPSGLGGDADNCIILPNEAPMANAGPDQSVTDTDNSGSESVTLDGSGSSDTDGTIESFVWSDNDIEIATGENPLVSLTVGTHDIILTVTDDDGATDTDTVTVTVNAGPDISDLNKVEYTAGTDITLYPNPSDGKLYIKSSSETNFNYKIFNSIGAVIREDSNILKIEIDLTGNPGGIYYIQIIQNENFEIQKFILH